MVKGKRQTLYKCFPWTLVKILVYFPSFWSSLVAILDSFRSLLTRIYQFLLLNLQSSNLHLCFLFQRQVSSSCRVFIGNCNLLSQNDICRRFSTRTGKVFQDKTSPYQWTPVLLFFSSQKRQKDLYVLVSLNS